MKKFTALFLSLLFITCSFVACNSDDDENTPHNSTGDYWPTAIDNNWVYTKDGTNSSIKIIGDDERNSATYYEFNQLDIFGRAVRTQSPIWIKKNQGDYYIKVEEENITVEGGNKKVTGYEFLFFKDYLEVDDTWEGTYTFTETSSIPDSWIGITETTYTGKILEKGISLNINGTVYNDVIKFRFTQILNDNSIWPDWDYSTDYWIAKNVGIIKFLNYEDSTGSSGDISEIKSHVIN